MTWFSRLELAYKDAVKKNKLYETAINLLMGLYYTYRNSSKQRKNLHASFKALGQRSVVPTRVGGTRWVSHLLLAIQNFLKGYRAITNHLCDCIAQEVSSLMYMIYIY